MFTIEWREKAVRQFEKIMDWKIRNQIKTSITQLELFPNCNNIKMLKNHKYDYRLRVGKYRVLFNVFTKVEIIDIQEVIKRDDQTY